MSKAEKVNLLTGKSSFWFETLGNQLFHCSQDTDVEYFKYF